MFAGLRTAAVARWRRCANASVLALISLACIAAVAGCFPPAGDVVLNPETGEPVLLIDIDPILNDADLTEAEKRQELLDLGLSEELADVLIRAS